MMDGERPTAFVFKLMPWPFLKHHTYMRACFHTGPHMHTKAFTHIQTLPTLAYRHTCSCTHFCTQAFVVHARPLYHSLEATTFHIQDMQQNERKGLIDGSINNWNISHNTISVKCEALESRMSPLYNCYVWVFGCVQNGILAYCTHNAAWTQKTQQKTQ